MSIIDRDPDPEATAKESVQKNMDRIFMDQKYDERRHREFVSGLRNQQYKFGLPFASKEDLRLEGLKSLPDGPMQIAADQCINQMEDEKERAEREREKLIRRRLLLTKHIACMDAIQPFFVEGPLELQANTCSRLHHLKDASVNPEHLRAVPRRVNGLENSVSPLAINASRTHCPSGHPYDYENTSIVVRNGKEGRVCRKCRSIVANEIHYRSRGKRHLLVQHVAFHLHEYARKPWRVEPDIMVEAQKLAAKIEKLRAKRRSKDHYVRMAALSAAKRLKCHEA